MEFYEVIEKRRSIREFQDKPIARNMLERILNAGLPPSSNHQRQWELLTLTDKEIILSVATIVKPYYCRITEPKTFRHEKRGASESAASRGGLQLLMSKTPDNPAWTPNSNAAGRHRNSPSRAICLSALGCAVSKKIFRFITHGFPPGGNCFQRRPAEAHKWNSPLFSQRTP